MSVLTRSLLAGATAAAIVAVPALTPLPEATTPKPSVAAPPAVTPQFRDIVLAAHTRAVTTRAAASDAAVAAISPGNAIIEAWYDVVPWLSYGVELADYVLGFVPFGFAVADQINIVYDNLLPIADSFVVDLVAPVADSPLDLAVWLDGIGDVVATAVNSLVSLGIAEYNYCLGWLIPPLPPLPPLATEASEAGASLEPEPESESESVGTIAATVVEDSTTPQEVAVDDAPPPAAQDLPEDLATRGAEVDARAADDEDLNVDLADESEPEAVDVVADDSAEKDADEATEATESPAHEDPDHEGSAQPDTDTDTDTDGGETAAP